MQLRPLKRGRGGAEYSRVGSALAAAPKAIGSGHSYGSNSRLGAAVGKNIGYGNLGTQATTTAIRPMPRTAKLAIKVKPPIKLSAITPPMPRGKTSVSSSSPKKKSLGARVKSAVSANRGNNQAKALARMKAASRR